MGIASLHPSYDRRDPRVLAARFARGLHLDVPPLKREQGRPGARCTRGLACQMRKQNAHEHTGSAEAIRHSLRNGFTAYAVLSRRRIRLVTVAAGLMADRIRSDRCRHRQLGTSNGCRDHTVLPYASAPFVLRSECPLTENRPAITSHARRCRVHRIPSRVRDDRETPLTRVGRARL